jgi:hypothetical protein
MLMTWSGKVRSKSSLLSDCTNGLVGGLYTKLDEKDEDKDDGVERYSSPLIEGGLERPG